MRTVACLVITTPTVFNWLGHMPIMAWAMEQLREVRGVHQICCVATKPLVAQTKALLANDEIDVTAIPPEVFGEPKGRSTRIDNWLSSADGPACDADIIISDSSTSPFLPAGKIEACLRSVASGKYTAAMPGRPTTVVATAAAKSKATLHEAVTSVRVFRVRVPAEGLRVVPITLIDSLNVDIHDEYRVASVLVEAGGIG